MANNRQTHQIAVRDVVTLELDPKEFPPGCSVADIMSCIRSTVSGLTGGAEPDEGDVQRAAVALANGV